MSRSKGGMTFLEACQVLSEEGRKVRRLSWDDDIYLTTYNNFLQMWYGGNPELELDDVLSEDWEVVR